jgi:putative membrane protein insertion efficiency factor
VKAAVIALLRAYRWLISPWLLPACRYVPTCSEYAEEAIERFGVLRGGCMAAHRLLRCHPFVKGGYDPVVQQQAVREECIPADAAR